MTSIIKFHVAVRKAPVLESFRNNVPCWLFRSSVVCPTLPPVGLLHKLQDHFLLLLKNIVVSTTE